MPILYWVPIPGGMLVGVEVVRLIVLGFNDTSTLVGLFVSFPSASVFNTSQGTWRMLMHEKPRLIPIV